MEQFDIEQQSQLSRDKPSSRRLMGRAQKLIARHQEEEEEGIGGQLISLRKYSAAICLVEALAIVLLIYLLLKLPTTRYEQVHFSQGLVSDTSSAPYRVYSDHLISAQLLLGPTANNCSQRSHDLAHSVKCYSSRAPGECQPVEQLLTQASLPIKDKTHFEIIETSRAGSRLTKRRVSATGKLIDARATTIASTLAVVYRKRRHQRIIGWGGALTDSTINNVLSLTINATRNLLDDYFGFNGLRFNLARVTIGGSDFSARFYTNDDHNVSARASGNPASEPELDWRLENFKLMDEDRLYKIPILKFIQSEYFHQDDDDDKRDANEISGRSLKVFASMWSPPIWMKDNWHFNRGQLRRTTGANSNFNANNSNSFNLSNFYNTFNALARLKIKWLEAYREAGVSSLWGLTVMNEPIFAIQPFLNFNTMIFPRQDYASYLSLHLGPLIRQHPVFKNLKLMVHDDNRRYLNNFTRPLMGEPSVRKYIDGVSVHGYVDEEYNQMSALYRDYFQQPKTQINTNTNYPADNSFFLLPTELCSGHLPFMDKALAGNWHRGVHYALDIIRSLQAMAAGWVDWNMVLDMEGGPGWLGGRLDAPILVDRARDIYHRSPMFYVLGQFSRYIPAGSQRLELEIYNDKYDKHYELVAFETPRAQLVIVIVNNNQYPVSLNWRIDETEQQTNATTLNYLKPETFFTTTSPAESVQTIIYNLSSELTS